MKRTLPAYCYHKGKNRLVYFCRRGAKPIRIHSAPGTPEFAAEYALLLKGRQPTPAKTMRKLIDSYRGSDEFKALAPNTRRSYDRHLDWTAKAMGDLDPRLLKRANIIDVRKAWADKPTTANRLVACLSVLFEHAIDLGWMPKDFNPAKGVTMLEPPKPPREPWPAEMIEAFRREASLLALLAFELALGTGQRIGDVLAMRWDQVEDGGIKVRQGKTGATLWVPFTPRLAAIIEDTPRLGETIIAQHKAPWTGKPASYSLIDKEIRRVREKIGAQAWDIHALRHSAASEIAALPGMTMEHVKAITGHTSEEMARLYAGRAAQKARAKEAQTARGKDEG